MAITLTKKVQKIETYVAPPPREEGEITYPTLTVVYKDIFDDPDDDQLPVITTSTKHFNHGDDVSGEDELVQTIASAIWVE